MTMASAPVAPVPVRLLARLRRTIDRQSAALDATLPDGSPDHARRLDAAEFFMQLDNYMLGRRPDLPEGCR